LHRLGPAARRLLEESGLSESSVKGTGAMGMVTKGDVLAAMARKEKKPTDKVGNFSRYYFWCFIYVQNYIYYFTICYFKNIYIY
jgi:hypothetical protein